MPSSSSSSSSCSSSCSSSSYHGFVAATGSVETWGQFEIISQLGNSFLINSGRAYDGYGNALVQKDRILLTDCVFPPSLHSDGYGEFGFLCVRQKPSVNSIDYIEHPTTGVPLRTKYLVDIEFYIVAEVIAMELKPGFIAYYPPVDSNGVLDGIVIGKVYKNGVHEPDMFMRSSLFSTKNGADFPVYGFNLV